MTAPKYPTKSELEEVFEICNGELWRKAFVDKSGNRRPPRLVNNKVNSSDGYCQVGFKYRMVRYHTIFYILHNGDIPEGYIIDHIDGNRTNNHPSNLRLVNHRGNQHNRESHRGGRLPGTHFLKESGLWVSRVTIGGERRYIGQYLTEQEAYEACKKYCKTDRLT